MNLLKNLTFFTLLFSFFLPSLNAQNAITVVPPPNIKAIILKPRRPDSYAPIIKLGETLEFSFDDINAEQRNYSYKIEHCDYDWKVSNIFSTQFMSGYAQDRIRDFENSFNTLQSYTHYKLEVPNRNNRIKISGNYLISVLDEYSNVIFSRRFIIYEPKTTVGVTAHRSRDISFINEKHNVEFIINHPNLLLNNPSEEIKVAIYQNGDWNSILKNIRPKYIKGSQLFYNYVDQIPYWAGNEFLYFDTKEIRNATNNIAKTRLNNIFSTYLFIDESRGNRPYSFYPDINGNFVLRTIDSENTSLEGDYSFVHFLYKYDQNFNDDNIYIYGAFNDWQITEENRMMYNSQTNLYEARLMLKQGFYNYTYVSVDGNGLLDKHTLEGSMYQTENEYSIIVYYRKYGELYDQVIGFGTANSRKLEN